MSSPIALRSYIGVGVIAALEIGLALAVQPSWASAQSADPAARVVPLAPGIFVIETVTGNALVRVRANDAFVAGYESPVVAAQVRALLRKSGSEVPRFVVLTDGPGAADLADAGWTQSGALVFAQESLRARIVRESRLAADGTGRHATPPIVGFSDVLQLPLIGDDAHVVHQVSGYSSADVIVHLERERVIFLGRAYVSNGYPRIDDTNGGALDGLVTQISWFVQNFAPDTAVRFIPGVGEPTTGQRLREYLSMLKATRDTVQALIAHGKSLQEILADQPTRRMDPAWAHGDVSPRVFVESAYRSLAEHR